VAEDVAHDALPAGAVEEGGLRAGHDEGVPRARGGGRRRDDRRSMDHGARCAIRPHSGGGARRLRRGRSREDLVHPAPAEVAQQLRELAFHAVDVDVVAEARLGVDAGDARLRGVDLPGMEIEDGGWRVAPR
jgi:hypothetical protein